MYFQETRFYSENSVVSKKIADKKFPRNYTQKLFLTRLNFATI